MTIHNLTINDEDIFFDIDGTEYCYEAHLLSYLLYHEIVFQYFNNNSLCLAVCCNDIFAWASADAEAIESEEELIDLGKKVFNDPKWGYVKWTALKRNYKPQRPIIEAMKSDNSWDETMESLPCNTYNQ